MKNKFPKLKKNFRFYLRDSMEADNNQTVEYFKRPHPIWYALIIPSMIYLSVSFFIHFQKICHNFFQNKFF